MSAEATPSWYDPDPDLTAVYQGDIVSDVPVVFMPPKGETPWILLSPSPPVTRKMALDGNIPKNFRPLVESQSVAAWENDEELVLARAVKHQVIIVTQTCDIDRRKFIQVAPIYLIDRFAAEKADSIRERRVNYLFPVPAIAEKLKESYADLSHMTSIHKSYIRQSKTEARLTPRAQLFFQTHLAQLHGRPFGFNSRDKVPQSGKYTCLNCVHESAEIHQIEMKQGDQVASCTKCDERAVWTKAP